MDLKKFFERVVGILNKEKLRYALAGGFVASLYRAQERSTKDLDFLICSQTDTQRQATRIIASLGLHPHVIRKADLEGGPLFVVKRKKSQPYMIVGRKEGDPSAIGLDFILPEMPWFESALARAERNNIDFGFGKVACLTVEDVILSKFYSWKNDQTRFNDLDDLKSIFSANHPLDLAYLAGQMQRLALTVPQPIKKMVPNVLNLVSRRLV